MNTVPDIEALYASGAEQNGFDSAFAHACYKNDDEGFIPAMSGLTKREYFAAAALTGLCANSVDGGYTPEGAAGMAVKCADALLLRLERN